jgi:3-hydroxy acid dehydrogenase/malonic semialdehyde reductase
MSKTIFITGATSGFGKAIAEKFASQGHRLIITGRRAERLQEVSKNISIQFSVEVLPLCFDVRDRKACFDAVASLEPAWQHIDILVNNAGLALGRDSFENANLDDWDIMLDTNVKGLAYMTKAILPLMIKAGAGHIINMGSIAGKEVYQNGNGYCASKYAVDALSQSMRVDLLPYNIKVTAINPGAAQTEFSVVRFKGDEAKANAMYEGYKPLQPEDIADVVHYVTTLPPHVCINDLSLTPIAQGSSFYLRKQ